MHYFSTAQILHSGISHLRLCLGAIDLSKPGNALGIWICHTISKDSKRPSFVLRRLFTNNYTMIPRSAIAALFSIEGVFTSRIKGVSQLALHACFTQLCGLTCTVHLIDHRTRNCFPVSVCHYQIGRHSDNGLLTTHLIARCEHNLLLCAGERVGCGIINGISALRNSIFQLIAFLGIGRNVNDEISEFGNIIIFSCASYTKEPCQQ